MIHIFFVAGMFGSTLEYVIRSHTSEYSPIKAGFREDGSMHSFNKECHTWSPDSFIDGIKDLNKDSILTPTYPFLEYHLDEILEKFHSNIIEPDDRLVLIHAPDLRAAELNMLFQYRKVATGSMNLSLDIFCGGSQHNISNWNKAYTSWRDMQAWELREWISIFYPKWILEWIESPALVDDRFLIVSNMDFLENPAKTWREILAHCNLTESIPMETFAKEWTSKQQYIVNEFELIDTIIDSTMRQRDVSWEPLSIIAEAIIQKRLRDLGYEIKCFEINEFPQNTKTLYSLLEKV